MVAEMDEAGMGHDHYAHGPLRILSRRDRLPEWLETREGEIMSEIKAHDDFDSAKAEAFAGRFLTALNDGALCLRPWPARSAWTP